VIRGDRIVEVLDEPSAGAAAGCATVVDGFGKFVIPGLWDMHAHGSRRESLYPLYIANGVTGVREMFGPPDARAFRAALAAKRIDAPHIYLASPILDGTPPIWGARSPSPMPRRPDAWSASSTSRGRTS
jgi:imidazolonepropionase-like amidohydrolase